MQPTRYRQYLNRLSEERLNTADMIDKHTIDTYRYATILVHCVLVLLTTKLTYGRSRMKNCCVHPVALLLSRLFAFHRMAVHYAVVLMTAR
jgi:hypothetical protein